MGPILDSEKSGKATVDTLYTDTDKVGDDQ